MFTPANSHSYYYLYEVIKKTQEKRGSIKNSRHFFSIKPKHVKMQECTVVVAKIFRIEK